MKELITDTNQKRSHKVLAVVDALLGLSCIAVIGVLVHLAQNPAVAAGKDAGGISTGISVAAFVFTLLACLYLLCSFGLFKRWRWAWWFSLLMNLTFAVLIWQDAIEDWQLADREDIALGTVVGVVAILHLAEPLWQRVRKPQAVEVAESVVSR